MLSSISSYIWGDSGSEDPLVQAQPIVTATTGPPIQLPAAAVDELSPVTEDWVLVGGHPPAPGNLTGAGPAAAVADLADIALATTPSTTNTTSSSEASSEADDDERHADDGGDHLEAVRPAQMASLPLAASHLGQEPQPTPRTAVRSVQPATQLKSLKSAQICRQRNSGKALSSKSLNRSNKAVRRESIKYNMSIKAAGFNKNLKQC